METLKGDRVIKRRERGTGVIEGILRDYIRENKTDVDGIRKYVDERVEFYFGDGKLTRKIDISYPDRKNVESIDNPHMNLEKLIRLISAGQDCYLYGPPGTSKSTTTHQVAKILKLPFAYASLCKQSSEVLLFGFMAAGGLYIETEFYRLYRDGGVFCLDEMDNANGNLLSKLNSLLENGHGSFPCGTIKRNPKFVLIGTGNTNGNGASLEFPDRTAFDPAFKERFVFCEWPLDENQEKAIALSINPEQAMQWLETVQAIRGAVVNLGIERIVVSPRATYKGCALLRDGFTAKECCDMLIFKGAPGAIVKNILTEVKSKKDASATVK